MSEAARGAAGAGSRPRFRNIDVGQIVQYRLPPAGIVSILHRVSGALMFLVGLPFVLYCLQLSVGSDASFGAFRALAAHPIAKLLFLALIWAYLHHFCAGIRYLLLDLHVGTDKDQARTSALSVIAVGLALTLLFALKLFGAF